MIYSIGFSLSIELFNNCSNLSWLSVVSVGSIGLLSEVSLVKISVSLKDIIESMFSRDEICLIILFTQLFVHRWSPLPRDFLVVVDFLHRSIYFADKQLRYHSSIVLSVLIILSYHLHSALKSNSLN